MDKVRFISPIGKKVSEEQIEETMRQWNPGMPSVPTPPVQPPKDFREFEDRVIEFEEKLRSMLFGFTYNLETGKTLKREKSPEAIVEALCSYDKYSKGILLITEFFQSYTLLKLVLEQDAPFVVCDDVYLLGFSRDRSGLSLPQKNMIAVHAAAQILWYLKKNKIPTIAKMRKCLLNKRHPLYGLLSLHRFQNERTLNNWLGAVFPVPKEERKGRPSSNEVPAYLFNNLIPIPDIIQEDGKRINILKLQFAIRCITRILKTLEWSVDEISDSIFMQLYQRPLKFYLCLYAADWIKCAFAENGSIFT